MGSDRVGIPEHLRLLADAEKRSRDGKWEAAAKLWRDVVGQNPVNGNHWDRLAQALYESGDFAGALRAYEETQRLGVWSRYDERQTALPGEISYRIACCHARLGDDDRAIQGLDAALTAGFRDLERPRLDEAWKALRASEKLRRLLGIVDAGSLSRDEGWRGDVEFFARQLKRRACAPWVEISEAEFDEAIAGLSAEVDQLSDAQIVARFLGLLRHLQDGHAGIAPATGSDLNHALPLKFYTFEEGTFVTAAAPENAHMLGLQLLTVAGQELDSVWAALDAVICQDNAQQMKLMAPELLRWTPLLHALGLSHDPRRVELGLSTSEGRTVSALIVAVPVPSPGYPDIQHPYQPLRPFPEGWRSVPGVSEDARLPLYLRNTEVPYWFEHLTDERVVYLQFNAVRDHPDEPFAAFCDRVFDYVERHDIDKLVLDLRWNGGGNTFISQPFLHHLIACRKIDAWGFLFVIIGRATFSAAQNTATALERDTKAIFVGEPTGSRPNFVGETTPFELPFSKTRVNVSDLYWQTSWPLDGRLWISPDLYAPPTFATYRVGRDPALEAILSYKEHLPGR